MNSNIQGALINMIYNFFLYLYVVGRLRYFLPAHVYDEKKILSPLVIERLHNFLPAHVYD